MPLLPRCVRGGGHPEEAYAHVAPQYDIPPECPICFKLLAGNATATTTCGHHFCRKCMEAALAIRSECLSCILHAGVCRWELLIQLYPKL